MDRIFRKLAPIVLIVLLLCGCAAPAQQQVTKQYGSDTVTVDYVKGTITFREDVYHFEDQGLNYLLFYPDGEACPVHISGGTVSVTDDISNIDTRRYLAPGVLASFLTEEHPIPVVHFTAFFWAFLIVGAAMLIFPRAFWFLSHGMFFRDSEPSDMALIFYRVLGGVCLVLAIVSLSGGLY